MTNNNSNQNNPWSDLLFRANIFVVKTLLCKYLHLFVSVSRFPHGSGQVRRQQCWCNLTPQGCDTNLLCFEFCDHYLVSCQGRKLIFTLNTLRQYYYCGRHGLKKLPKRFVNLRIYNRWNNPPAVTPMQLLSIESDWPVVMALRRWPVSQLCLACHSAITLMIPTFLKT